MENFRLFNIKRVTLENINLDSFTIDRTSVEFDLYKINLKYIIFLLHIQVTYKTSPCI